MKLLLDTHVLLWAVLNDPRLSQTQRAAIGEGEIFLSAVSVWEIGIKQRIGKLNVPQSLFDVAVEAGCRPLPISWEHAQTAAALPLIHNDPFDRMLIAQALEEGLVLASSDTKFSAYGIELLR